jgi:uncharacterized membrane protein
MSADYLLDWVNLLLRWLHVVTGIAWIGASFYFVWLDNSLKPPADRALADKGVAGELWAVHGGGFYNPQKYLVAPKQLPAELHWFKWESYSTWLSGFALLAFLYYANAGTYLVDKSVADLSPAQAIGLSLAFLAGGWIVYDLLCRSALARHEGWLGLAIYLLLVAAGWALLQLFSGRAAFLHVGAIIATIMSANVLFVIIPGQRKTVAQMQAGLPVDAQLGLRAKQRSVHNNYFTLPVLFAMLSNHYAFTYSHPRAWLLMALVLAAGFLMRLYFNLQHKGRHFWSLWLVVGALALLAGALVAPTRPHRPNGAEAPVISGDSATTSEASSGPVDYARIAPIVAARCAVCHAERPSYPGFAAAPKGVLLQTEAQLRQHAKTVYEQTVRSRAMPIGNVTGLSEDERALIGAFAAAAARP